MRCARILGLVTLLSLSLPALAQGEVIRYAWSGTIERRLPALTDPLGIGGDGVFATADGATYALAVYVDSAATGAFAPPEGMSYPVLDVELLINGQAAAITTVGE